MLVHLNIRVDRMSPKGIAWANRVRAALGALNAEDAAGVRWHLLVDCKPDSVEYLFDNIGRLVGAATGVIFLILAAAFRSPVIALRSLVSLAALEARLWHVLIPH